MSSARKSEASAEKPAQDNSKASETIKASETTAIPTPAKPSERIIDALMALAAEKPYDEIALSEIADRAGATLAEFRACFPSKGAILGAFERRIDEAVLKGSADELAAEPARERLFDAFMRRIDALTPYKPALANIDEAVRKDPLFALALNQPMLNSMRFMLAYARLEAESDLSAIKLQGLVLAWRRIFTVWLDDDEPGLGRTMAEIDKILSRGERLVSGLETAQRVTAPLRSAAQSLFEAGRSFTPFGRQKRDR